MTAPFDERASRRFHRWWSALALLSLSAGPLWLALTRHDLECVSVPGLTIFTVISHEDQHWFLSQLESQLQIHRARSAELPRDPPAEWADLTPGGQPVHWVRMSPDSGGLFWFGRDGLPGGGPCAHDRDAHLWLGVDGSPTAPPTTDDQRRAQTSAHNMALRHLRT